MRSRSLALLFIALGAALTPARADEPVVLQRSAPALLKTTASVDKSGNITLAFTDVLTLIVEVNGAGALEVQPPERWTQGLWLIRPAGPEQRSNGHWSQTLDVEPTVPGDGSLILEPLKVREGTDAWRTVTWKPIAVHVTSKLQEPEVKQARDITAIEELPALPTVANRNAFVMVAVGAALLLCGAAWLAWRRRTSKPAGTSLEARGLAALERLQALRLPEHGKHERFGTLLAGLLCRYLEKKHQVPARRRTTAEFLTALEQHPTLGGQRAFFEKLLRRCDLLKFAPVESTVDECRALADEVRKFLSEARDSPPPFGHIEGDR